MTNQATNGAAEWLEGTQHVPGAGEGGILAETSFREDHGQPVPPNYGNASDPGNRARNEHNDSW